LARNRRSAWVRGHWRVPASIAQLTLIRHYVGLRFCDLFEHSPWVAERAWRPEGFIDAATMVTAMAGVVAQASADEQLALLRVHPELAGREARAGE